MDPFISQDVYSVLCCPLQHFGPGDGIWNPCPTRVTCPHLSWPYRQYLNEYRALDLDRVGCRICQKVVRIFNQIFSCLHSSYSVWICFHGFFFSYFHITTRQLRFKIKIFLPLDEQPSWAKKSYLPDQLVMRRQLSAFTYCPAICVAWHISIGRLTLLSIPLMTTVQI